MLAVAILKSQLDGRFLGASAVNCKKQNPNSTFFWYTVILLKVICVLYVHMADIYIVDDGECLNASELVQESKNK